MKTYAFIDASNLFYGGEKSLGWKVDYKKLINYLKNKYSVDRVLYFGGIEIGDFDYDYVGNETVDIDTVIEYLTKFRIEKYTNKAKFYKRLKEFGYELFLKPVKIYKQLNGTEIRKANVDVDMTFHLMKERDNFSRVVILSGDGDFLPIFKYLKNECDKELMILSISSRTAKEIKQLVRGNFRDFKYLREVIKYK